MPLVILGRLKLGSLYAVRMKIRLLILLEIGLWIDPLTEKDVISNMTMTPNNALHRDSRSPRPFNVLLFICSFWLRSTVAVPGCG